MDWFSRQDKNRKANGRNQMITSIDTNILLDILVSDPEFGEQSKKIIQQQSNAGSLVICPVVYSELLVFFLRVHGIQKAASMLEEFLKDLGIQIVQLSMDDFTLAAESWQKIQDTQKIRCPKCGASNIFRCTECNSAVMWRNHIITDFLIGAHAQNHSDALITRDKGYYKRHFRIRILH